ncbi:MAG: Lrp/AsnC family transcriptional regulator [Bacteroidaceae bacterium]|nr:Lrp/AsnC family transcriptional regulator [Bacteroidaceae bacterium]
MTENIIREHLDDRDIAILRALQQDARLTTKQLAQKVHLSPTPTYERVKRLERDGYIKRYITILDAEKLNKGFVVYCSVKLSPLNKQVAQQFCDTIMTIDEVTECYNISGKFDYMLRVHCPDMKYYQQFILNVLGSLPMLGSLESTFVMEEIKHRFGVAI